MPAALVVTMIVHSESTLWQVEKGEIVEMGSNNMDRIGVKAQEEQAGGKRRGRRPE